MFRRAEGGLHQPPLQGIGVLELVDQGDAIARPQRLDPRVRMRRLVGVEGIQQT